MERNQQMLEKINNLEQQTDSYAIENWEFLKKSLLRCMIAQNPINLLNMFKKNPYIELLNKLAVYNIVKMEGTLDYTTVTDTVNIYEDIQKTFLSQKNIFPNITNENPIFQNYCNLLIEKFENFICGYFNLLNYEYNNNQNLAKDSLHFELNIKKNIQGQIKEIAFLPTGDYLRTKEANPKRRRFMSNFQIAAFYNRDLLKTENPPNEKILLYWIAFDNLVGLSNDEKTKLAQLLNTDDASLSEEQKNLKNKILDNDDFKNNIIISFKESFLPWPQNNISEITLENVNDNLPDKNHVVYILHAPEENLTKFEKQFKTIFLANPIQEIYAQFYKNFHNVDEVPNDKLLTEDQIGAINRISSKVMRSSLIKYKVAKSAKKFLNSLNSHEINTFHFYGLTNWFEFPSNISNTDEQRSAYINNIMLNPENLSEKNQKAINRINEIKKLTFLYKPDENFPDSLTNDQKTALSDLYDLCFDWGQEFLPKNEDEKIESLKYVKENDEFFDEYIENPEFTKLDEDIKGFIIYKENSRYDTKSGLTKGFNNLSNSNLIGISQYLPNNFKTLIENFDPKLPSDEELNTELENLYENTFDEIEEQYIPFEKWRLKHQIHQICQITQGRWQNFFKKGNGFLQAVYNGELNTYLDEQNAVEILSFAITAKLSCYPDIKHKILNKLITSKKLSPQIKNQLCIDNNITKKKYWPKILGIIAGVTLGILGIGIALATGGIGTAILGMIGTIIASHTTIFATIASIGIAIGATITGIFSKKVNEAKSINSTINLKSKNGYTLLMSPDEISDTQEKLSNDINESKKTSLKEKIQDAEETSEEQKSPNLDTQEKGKGKGKGKV